MYDFSNAIVIDTETTGLPKDNQNQEVLSIAITNLDGDVLFYDLIKPTQRKRWPNAQEIHGISPADVTDKMTLQERIPELEPIINNASVVVGYNVHFDIDMLHRSGLDIHKPTYDVMQVFSDRHNNGRYAKLIQCAAYYGYDFKAHNALEDTKATAYCCKCLLNEQPSQPESQDEKLGCGAWICVAAIILIIFVVIMAVIL